MCRARRYSPVAPTKWPDVPKSAFRLCVESQGTARVKGGVRGTARACLILRVETRGQEGNALR